MPLPFGKVPPLVLEQRQVLQRIPVDEQQICPSSRLQAAELPLAPQHARRNGRRRTDDVDRLHNLRAQSELAALLDLELAKQIGAECDRDAGALADLE
jgi:hypothetical protein